MFNKDNFPNSWIETTIKNSCELIMGQSPPGSSYNEEGNGMPFLQGKAEFGKIFPNHIKFTTDPKRKTKKGSILMSVRAPVGDVNIANIDYCIGRGLASLNLKNGDNKYLFYLLNYLKPKIEESGTGSTFKAINKSGLEKIKIPVPPLETQNKIVEILEKAEKLKKWRTEADELADDYLKSVFLEMFGDPLGNTKNWPMKKISDLCETSSGGTPSRSKKEYYSGKIPWVKSGELNKGIIHDTEEKITELGMKNSSAKLVEPNTVLIAMYGATVGKTALLKIKATTNQAVCAINPNKDHIDNIYLLNCLKSLSEYLISQSIGGGQPNISQQIIKKTEIPIPPITLQNQFAQIVQRVETLKTHQAQSKQEIDNLFNTLMQKAFKGELVC